MIRHVVAFTMAAPDAETRRADAEECARRLNGLLGVTPSLRTMTAGANMLFADTNWDLVLVADFDDEAGLEEYVVHPAHQEVVAFMSTVRKDRVAVDFVL